MKIVTLAALLAAFSVGCISSSSPAPPPTKTVTVVVPQGAQTTVICSDGTKPPCK